MSTTDCTAFNSNEKWAAGDRWNPTFVAKQKIKPPLNCPVICANPSGLCRSIATKDAVDWTKYNLAIKYLSATSSFPSEIKTLDRMLGTDIVSKGRTDPIELSGGYIFQEGPQIIDYQEGNVDGADTFVTFLIPNRLRAKYSASSQGLALDFEDRNSQSKLSFSDSKLTALYGGQIRAVWFQQDKWIFATDKRCVAVSK